MIFTSFKSSFFVKFTAIYNFLIQLLWDYSVSFSVLKTSVIFSIQGVLRHQSVFECIRSTHNQKLMTRKWIMQAKTLLSARYYQQTLDEFSPYLGDFSV